MELVACASSMAPSMLKGTIHRFKSSICLVQMICFRECFAYFSMIMLRFDAGVWYNTITSFPFPKVQQLASSVHRWLQTVVKGEGMLQSLKMALFCGVFLPSKLFFFSLFYIRMVLLSTFKHLICFLCYIMNKWWANEIGKLLHSVAFFILQCIPAFFWNWGCIFH